MAEEVGNTQSISNCSNNNNSSSSSSPTTTAEEAVSSSASPTASSSDHHPNENDENDDSRSDTTTATTTATANSAIPEPIRDLLPATLSRLTAGLPMHELDIIIKEATACEDAL
mmetsp:Transcript_9590/g.17300  ORF Transcript_9590/g.17300 Transcript_9590/m.17300 type:complete len:114 (-) Transcript_9590:1803-2144(-)